MFTKKFKDHKQFRLPEHNYASDGFYFVTICTKNREEWFGGVKNTIMGLNKLGCMTTKFWQDIPNYFENVILDQWVVMPNHLHGVIQIFNKTNYPISRRNMINHVPTEILTGIPKNPMKMKQITLGKIIRWYKGRTSFEIRKIDQNFAWQPRFWDRVIRNEKELNRIRDYIWNNPWKWERDRNSPDNIWI